MENNQTTPKHCSVLLKYISRRGPVWLTFLDDVIAPWYSLQLLTLFTPIWSWLSTSVPNVSLACLMRSRWHEREEVRENSWWYFHRESFVKCEVSFLISIESQSLKTLQEGRVDLIHAFAQKCFFSKNSMQDSS